MINEVDFDGTDDKINLGDFTHLNSASAFTVSMWVKSSATNVSYGLMSKYKDANSPK